VIRPDLDVVVVAYRSLSHLPACLEAALDLTPSSHIVVVDHGGDGSDDFARMQGVQAISDPRNPGFASGQNRGVALGTAPLVLILNPDAVVNPHAVKSGMEWLAEHPEVAAVQGAIVDVAGAPERSAGRELGPLHLLGRALGLRNLLRLGIVRCLASRSATLRDHVRRVPTHPVDVESLAATALLIRRSAFEDIGGFDAGYFLYGEDLDLCRRLRLAGWKLIALPYLWASHANGSSSKTPYTRELHWWRGTMRFGASWWSPTGWRLAQAAATVMWMRLLLRAPRKARTSWRLLLGQPSADRRTTRVASDPART